MRTSTFLSLFLLLFFGAEAQVSQVSGDTETTYSLQDCITYALKNNVQLRQAQLSFESGLNELERSKQTIYPTVNGQFNLNSNFGRNIDPFSNDIVTQAIGTNTFGVGSNVTLYNGHRIKNTIKRNELSLQASQLDLLAQKNNISLQVAVAYLNVLSSNELVKVAEKNLEVTQIQLERTTILVRGGALPETNVFDLNAQVANNELQLVNAQNNIENAKLGLRQAMNILDNRNFEVTEVTVANPSLSPYPQTATEVYEAAISYLPDVKAAKVREEVAQKNIEIAKAVGIPSIFANANWGTAFSTVAKRAIPGDPTFTEVPVSAVVDGQTVAGIINFPQQNFTRENIPYFSQIGNNQNANLGIGMSIPIFNGNNKKFQMQAAKIQKLQSELNSEGTLLGIRQSIDQAYITMSNAAKNYSASQAQVEALTRSFEAAESRFSQGASTFVDYNLAKTQLDSALANLIQAKYDYLFRVKILDFYQNIPLSF